MIKRYRATLTAHNGFASIGMIESPNDDYVLYTDHRAECERVVREAAYKAIHRYIHCSTPYDEAAEVDRIVREVMATPSEREG